MKNFRFRLRKNDDGEEANGDSSGVDMFSQIKKDFPPAVINIETTYPRDFEYYGAGSSKATGFIVDKEKGLILTNKHVVMEGPCRAKGLFQKHEEIDLYPIYRDPVHDFGFFRFDPSELKDTPLVEIELDAEGAKQGMKGLMMGNNEGEKLTFIEVTISRLDRPAMQGLDLNTFYITTSDTSVGGSSGSPLLSTEGKAVAMMAAGRQSTSFFLPLQRVARTLEYLRKDEKVPRGTLQVGFKYQTFEALLKRNAITEETKDRIMKLHDKSEGMLVVDKAVPKGPGREAGLENGDVLLSINNTDIQSYLGVADMLDTFIGKEITLTCLRDLEEREFKTVVQDHEEISVTKFVEVSNGLFRELRYMYAINENLPLEGVFIAKGGYMFSTISDMSVIKKIGKNDIKTLDDFIKTLQSLRNGETVAIRYQQYGDQTKTLKGVVTVDKRWYPFQLAVRDDKAGRWNYENLFTEEKSLATNVVKKKTEGQEAGEGTEGVLDIMANAYCEVRTSQPFNVDGSYDGGWVNSNSGLVIDKELGIVMTTKSTASRTLCDVQLIFNRSKIIPATVMYISADPVVNVSFIKYDPSLLLDDATVTVSDIKLSEERPKIGEELMGVGTSYGVVLQKKKCVVEYYYASGEVESAGFSKSIGGDGLYVDEKTNEVKAFDLGWGTYLSCHFAPTVDLVIKSTQNHTPLPTSMRFLAIQTDFINIYEARINYLTDKWAETLKKTMKPYQQSLLLVRRKMVTSDAYEQFEENDIILSINEKPVTLLREFYEITRNEEKVKVRVLRDSEEIDLEVKTTSFSTLGTSRLLHFAGLILQAPHDELLYSTSPEFIKEGGVFVTHKEYGSPAESAESGQDDYIDINQKLVYKVNDKPVKDIEEFLEAVQSVKHLEFVRLLARDLTRGEETVHDIRLDLEYWKTRDMYFDESGEWKSKLVEHDK